MAAHTDGSRVVVVGGGLAGCQTARELAPDHDVVVLEREHVGAGATALSAGLVAPTLFYGDLPEVARYANRFVRRFDGTHGFEFTERERLDFVAPADEPGAREDAAALADRGFPVTYLEPSTLAERYPQFDLEGIAGAVHYADTGWVDPYTYATALGTDAEARGATFETGRSVTGIETDGDRVTGVRTADGRYEADAVVVAAGWRTRELLPESVPLAIRPYRTQCVVLSPEEPLADDFPLGRVGHEHLYFRPEHNGDLLVGGAHETIDDPLAASGDADESFTHQVAAFVPRFLEGFDAAGFVNGWSGVDVATPDARPIVDAPPNAPEGLLVATGFNGLGVMTSPIVGPLVRHRLTGAPVDVPTAPFDADRFETAAPSFEYVSTSDL